jgi:hypothetical protein
MKLIVSLIALVVFGPSVSAAPGALTSLAQAIQAANSQVPSQFSQYIDSGVYQVDGSTAAPHCDSSNAEASDFRKLYVPVELLIPGKDRRQKCTSGQQAKFSAVGPIQGVGQANEPGMEFQVNATATLVKVPGFKDLDGFIVNTSAHVFVGDSSGASNVLIRDRNGNPDFTAYSVYLPACKKSYRVVTGVLGTQQPMLENDKDFAVLKLATKACKEAVPMSLEASSGDDLRKKSAQGLKISTVAYYEPIDTKKGSPMKLASISSEKGLHNFPIQNLACYISTGPIEGVAPGGYDFMIYDMDTDHRGSGGPLVVDPDAARPQYLGMHARAIINNQNVTGDRPHINGGIWVDSYMMEITKQFLTSLNGSNL